jgi:hypothetical protein
LTPFRRGKHYKIAEDQSADSEGGEIIPWSRESSDSILRQVARDARWHAFLFHGSYYWTEILSQYFLPPGQPQDNFPADDEEVLRARSKLVDIVRNLKCDTLKKFDSHIAQVMVDHPELGTMNLADPTIIKNFFIDNVWSVKNFEYIWFWMRGYVDMEKSSELAKFFNKRESPLSELPPAYT